MPKWLRVWSLLTVAATVGLLVLGALVTSFGVGMADPVWPTEPWRLAFIDWSEPSAGFLIEHTHRLAGFIIGGMMAILALGIWWTEPKPKLRWGGVAALVGLLAAFGYLHGVLIRQTKLLEPGAKLIVPPDVSGLLVLALAALLGVAVLTALSRAPGWGNRLLAIALLLSVMIQGLFGGLRVYFNSLFGPEFAVVHGAFAQIVFGLAVIVSCVCYGRQLKLSWIAWLAIGFVYAQIVFGVLLRQLSSPMGARLHLLTAFVAIMSVLASSRLSWNSARPWAMIAISLVVVQIGLGVESWLMRYADGLFAAKLRPITLIDATLRTTHAVVGYLLFATTIALSFRARRAQSTTSPSCEPALEGVA